ncbi:tetratricopeptide repeat-containing sensor histidine kinase [Emticicia sp. SJ17W-69]|uniref:tetratricopeptide repeat-containing sensor histidine kinase n=1 Tax=Emticicia sp. SJ17W-69 TaxID=3421657 RepID=UPI003EBB81B7
MKKYICCFILLLCSFYIHAQSNKKLDSLKKVLSKLPPEGRSFAGDTTKVRVLCEMGILSPTGQENSTLNLVEKAIVLSQKIKWNKGLANSYYRKGYLYASKNEDIKGIEYLFKSLAIAEKIKDSSIIAQNYQTLGDCHSRLRDYKKAILYLNNAVNIYKKLNQIKNYLISLNNLGLVYYDSQNYKTAMSYFNNCLELNKIYKIPNINIHFLVNLGSTHRFLKDYDKALKNLQKAKNIQDSIKNYPNFSKVMINIAIAEVWYYTNNFQKAIEYLSIAERLNSKGGTEVTEKYMYQVYYKVFKKLNNFQKSLYYYEKYIALNEMSTKQDFNKQVENMQFEYENEKKIGQINLLNQSLEKETLLKKIFIGGAVFLLLFGIWFWWSNTQLSTKNKQIEKQQKEILIFNNKLEDLNKNLEVKVNDRTKELLEANEELSRKNEEILTALVEGQTIERKRVAIELHDNLGSMLSGMKWRLQALNKEKLSEKEQKIYEGILSMMGDAYSEVRLISHNLLPAELEKSGLKGALQKLINDINQSKKLNISLFFDDKNIKIDKKIELELYSISMEIVNNILKHAEATQASIKLCRQNGSINLQIIDNGKGISDKIQANGVGLKNIKKRIEGLEGEVYINSQTGLGTQVVLLIPQA